MRYNFHVETKTWIQTDSRKWYLGGVDNINGFEKYRLIANLNQREVADKLGVNQSAVSTWEQGICYPSAPRLLEVSKLYGCTIENLLEGQNERYELKKQIKARLKENEKGLNGDVDTPDPWSWDFEKH